MSEPRASRVPVNGVEIQLYEWPGEDPPVLFAHATSFHARCWDQVIAGLAGRHVFAWDMRGHGLSSKPAPPYSWAAFGADVAALASALGVRTALGVGHSKGGHSMVLAAAAVPDAFGALLLVDPVIGPRERSRPQRAAEGDHFALHRRNLWSSPEEMYDSFRGRPPFRSWRPEVLRDYCRYGLVPNPQGEGYVLACPPEVEAAVYAGAMATDPYEAVARVSVPVRVLRARQRSEGQPMDMSGSPTAPDLAAQFRDGQDVFLPDYSHFIPMEAPELVARHCLEMLPR